MLTESFLDKTLQISTSIYGSRFASGKPGTLPLDLVDKTVNLLTVHHIRVYHRFKISLTHCICSFIFITFFHKKA